MLAIALITHAGIGTALRTAAERTLTLLPCPVLVFDVLHDADLQLTVEHMTREIMRVGDHYDWLLMSDLFGATPHNLAQQLTHRLSTSDLLSGVNLPMILRALSYAQYPLHVVAQKALEGAQQGVCGLQRATP